MMAPFQRRLLDGEILQISELAEPSLSSRIVQEPPSKHAVKKLGDASSELTGNMVVPGGGRVEPDVYRATESYRNFTLRYVHDPDWSGKVRVYVEDAPSYRERDSSTSVAHLWPARDGAPPYICFKQDHAPNTYAEARRLAEVWCDLTLRYIDSGVTISEQIARRGS
jgi:hypothetical protein